MPRQPGSRIRDYSKEPSQNPHGPKPTEPHSKWQLLVEGKRSEHKISLRDLATRAHIPSGTLFNWVRAKTAAPPRLSYTAAINRRLAAALHISAEELSDAYNQSAFQPLDPNAPSPAPAPAPKTRTASIADFEENLGRIVMVLQSTGNTSFTIDDIKSASSLVLQSKLKQ